MPKRNKQRTGCQYWFFRKEDVYALQADPDYIRHHRSWLAGIRKDR